MAMAWQVLLVYLFISAYINYYENDVLFVAGGFIHIEA